MTVFVDLDGTLIDPREGITRSIRHALGELGAELPEPDDLLWCIGPPLAESFATLLGPHGDVGAAVDAYRERFGEDGVFEAEVYDGIGEMLDEMRRTGHPVFIATSKPHIYAERIAEHFGIDRFVDGLFGAELDGTNADKAALLAHALAETATDPEAALMIGDRRHDVEGAHLNGMRALGALWGYGGLEELRFADADALAAEPGEAAEIAIEMIKTAAR